MRRFIAIAGIMLLIQFGAPSAFAAEEAKATDETKTAEETKQAGEPNVKGISAIFKVPLFSPLFAETPVATVDDEKITLDQLNDALASVHEGMPKEKQAEATDYRPVLDRIINTRLINLEAAETGIDELPEVKSAIKDYEEAALRELVKKRQTAGVKPDKAAVDKIYREAVKEWKVRSVIFDKEDDAKKMADDMKQGMSYEDASKKYIDAKKAKGGEEGEYVKAGKLLPQIAGTVLKMDKGAVSKVIKLESGYVILKVEDIRYPDDPKAKAEAESSALEDKRLAVLQKYYAGLVKKYIKMEKGVLASLDFDNRKPPFAEALKDKRVLVNIKGGKPITVAGLAEALNAKFFHGIERAIDEKKVNEQAKPTLDEMVYKALFDKEAARLGLRKTDEFRKLMEEYKTSLIFSAFIRKAIVPDIKVNEEETKKYYDGHISDFTYPEMVRLYSIAFGKLPEAESALAKLREGTDFKWLKANAEGQLGEDTPELLVFNGDLINVKSLPEDMQKALTGVKAGESRLYSGPGGQSYVLYVKDEVPAREQPYKEARESIAKKLYNEKLNKSVAEWADKLRGAHKVRIYLTGMGKTAD